jgi:hypothetical protein
MLMLLRAMPAVRCGSSSLARSTTPPPPVSPATPRASSPARSCSPPPHVVGSGTSKAPAWQLSVASSGGRVDLQEEKVFVQLDAKEESDSKSWIYDTGATNHMMGSQAAFVDLDTMVCGTV